MVLKLDAGDSGTKNCWNTLKRKLPGTTKPIKTHSPKPSWTGSFLKVLQSRAVLVIILLQQSPVTRRNLEWPLLRAPRHVAFAQFTFFCRCSMVFRCFLPNKCQGRGYFSMLMQHMGQKGPCWATNIPCRGSCTTPFQKTPIIRPAWFRRSRYRNHIKQEPNPADQVLFSKLCIAAQQMSPLFFPKSPLMRYNLECFHCRICEVNTFVQLKLCISGFPTEDAYKAKKDHAEPLVPPGRVQCIEAAAKQNSAAHANYEGVGGLLGDRNLESTIWKGGPQKSQKQNYQCPIWTLWHTLLRRFRSFDVLLYRFPLTDRRRESCRVAFILFMPWTKI